jgi:poly(A) polymerase
MLRCASGEIDREIGDWWTEFINGDSVTRQELLTRKPKAEGEAPTPKKRRRRGGRSKNKNTTGEGSNAPVEGGA